MIYQPLKVRTIEVVGINHSLRAMRLPKPQNNSGRPTLTDNISLAGKLVKAGDDHAKAMRGILVYVEVDMQVGWMIELVTYRIGIRDPMEFEDLSTSSTMHDELKMLSGIELAEQKQLGLKDKIYRRVMLVSYQALRNCYKARNNHRHPDWKIFCNWIESLPYFDELIMPEKKK